MVGGVRPLIRIEQPGDNRTDPLRRLFDGIGGEVGVTVGRGKVAPFRRDLSSLTLVAALNGPHSLYNPPPHQIRSLPEWVRRKVGITSCSLRLCMAEQSSNERQTQTPCRRNTGE